MYSPVMNLTTPYDVMYNPITSLILSLTSSLLYNVFMCSLPRNDLGLFIFWKEFLVTNGNRIDIEELQIKNRNVNSIVYDKFEIFPKSLDEFSKIKDDFMNTVLHFQDIIVVLKYTNSKDFDVLCKLPDENYDVYVHVIQDIFDKC